MVGGDLSRFKHILKHFFMIISLIAGDAMLRFLDDNWKEVLDELGPSVGDAIASVFHLIFSSITVLVPYKYIFVP